MYTYSEFRVDIRRGREGPYGSRITVECTAPDGGQTRPVDAEPTTGTVARLLPADTAEQRARLGEVLGQCMFPGRVLDAFRETLSGLPDGRGIRIRLRCDDEEMAGWPWELIRLQVPPRRSPRYLLRDERFSLIRSIASIRAVEPPRARPRLTVLAVDASRVRRSAELTPDFPDGVPGADSVLGTVMQRPTRKKVDEFIDRIVDGPHPLDIFHFTGHGVPPRGDEAGALVLHRDDDRGERSYPGNELAEQLDRAGTSLAFINACYSDDRPASGAGPGLAQALADLVPVVLAMRGVIGDDQARYFAAVFYERLLAGCTVDEAVARARLELDESDAHWQRAVLYSRASTGRFLEPAAPVAAPERSAAPAAPPAPPPKPEAIRRWAMVSGPHGSWQLVPGGVSPELRSVSSDDAADISHLRTLTASLVVSSDARVVAELAGNRLTLAWLDRVLPRLDPWPEPFELTLREPEPRLLATAVDYRDDILCVLSTDRATYRIDVSPAAAPVVSELFGEASRCAAIVAGSVLTVDDAGFLRGLGLNLTSRGIVRVSSIDAARSGGQILYAVAGSDEAGDPVVAHGRSIEALVVLRGVAADEVVVVRQLNNEQPYRVLLSRGGQLELITAPAVR